MKDDEKDHLASGINVGDVQGAGIVIGHGSSASINLNQSPVQGNAAGMLDEFIRLLQIHQNSVVDADGIRESAAAASAELAEPSPRFNIVRSLLRGIAAGVADVNALEEVISNIQAFVAHIST